MVSVLRKVKTFPRPHDSNYSYGHGLKTGVNNEAVLNTIVMNDYGLGSPASYNANPQHSSFAETAEPNCYNESKIEHINLEATFALTKAALETDKVPAVKFAHMAIMHTFDDILALDKVSTLDAGEILELQRESTDFQCYPLFNGVDALAGVTGVVPNHGANMPGLTTDQKIEAVTFNPDNYYDSLHYMTNGKKIKSMVTGLKWQMLTKRHPVAKFRYSIKPKVKAINDYTFFGLLTYVPAAGSKFQLVSAADTTNITHMYSNIHFRFNEWNDYFGMERA